MTIVGRKGYYRHQGRERKRIEDGKEVVIPGKWSRIYAVVAPNADDVCVPVVVQGTELDMHKYLAFVSEKRARAIVSGVHMRRFKDLTLEAKACRMVDLPGQKVSFMRREPDIDITKPEDRGTRYKPGEYRKHLGRMGFDVTQVYIPIIEKSGVGARIGDKTSIRIESFMCEEKGDKL